MSPVIVEGAHLTSERTRSEEEAREELQRIPGGVALIGSEEIQESRAANLKDTLDFIPGVLIRPRFGADESQFSIRGSGLRNNFHLRGVNVLIDGFPSAMPTASATLNRWNCSPPSASKCIKEPTRYASVPTAWAVRSI